MQTKGATDPLLGGAESKRRPMSSSRPSLSTLHSSAHRLAASSQPSRRSAATSTQFDQQLDQQRLITDRLDRQIADVAARMSQSQLTQPPTTQAASSHPNPASRRSSLRWNLAANGDVITRRRSSLGVEGPSAPETTNAESPAQTPIAPAVNEAAIDTGHLTDAHLMSPALLAYPPQTLPPTADASH